MDAQSFDSCSDSRTPSHIVGSPGSAPTLHQYSCTRCRARKVKCDKVISGCVHCKKVDAQCLYSARRSRKAQKVQQDLTMRPLLPTNDKIEIAVKNCISRKSPHETVLGRDNHSTDEVDEEIDAGDQVIPREMQNASFHAKLEGVLPGRGRLFVSQGKSRYVNSQKANQLVNFDRILSAESDSVEIGPSSAPTDSHKAPSFDQERKQRANDMLASSRLLDMANDKKSLRSDHPPLDMQRALWNYYLCNVDVLVKIIYKPDSEILVRRALEDMNAIDDSTEAFLFAIYFAAVTTMSADECLRTHQEQKLGLLQRYQNALEQALAKANWMNTQDIIVLQAITLLLICIPRKNIRSMWMLIGAAIGVAQAMGMHRDSTSFALNIADVELRRRIWWTLCLLDNRISEDCGLEVHVPITMDTKLPLHINDSDIDADRSVHLHQRTEFTEMTMSLVKLEMAEFSLKLKMSNYGLNTLSVDQMEFLAQEKIQHYKATYLQYLNTTTHLHRLCYLGTRLMVANIWKMAYDQCQQQRKTTINESDEAKEELIQYNTEVLEITHQLPDWSAQYGWFFGCKHTQWHAITCLLLNLRHYMHSASSVVIDRAWEVLDAVFRDLDGGKDSHRAAGMVSQKSKLWQSLLKLLKRLRRIRQEVLLQTKSSKKLSSDTLSNDETTLGLRHGTESTSKEHLAEEVLLSSTNATIVAPAVQDDGVLLGDPFIGSIQDLDFDLGNDNEMTWEEFDAMIENWQTEIVQQQEDADYQTSNLDIVLNW